MAAPQPSQCAANGRHQRRITARAGGPATTRGVLGEITCEKVARIPTTLRWRSGPAAAAVWLWSLRWSSAHEPPGTTDTPCCQPKQPWDQPKLRRKERRKLGMRTSVGRSSEPPSELRAKSEPRLRPNQSRMQPGAGGKKGRRRTSAIGDARRWQGSRRRVKRSQKTRSADKQRVCTN